MRLIVFILLISYIFWKRYIIRSETLNHYYNGITIGIDGYKYGYIIKTISTAYYVCHGFYIKKYLTKYDSIIYNYSFRIIGHLLGINITNMNYNVGDEALAIHNIGLFIFIKNYI